MEGALKPERVLTKQKRIAELAIRYKDKPLTSLSHYLDEEWLRYAYELTRKDGAIGVDGQTAVEYASNLQANLKSLLDRIKSGQYKAQPVRCTYVPKADGSKRPLGILTVADRIAQMVIKMMFEPTVEPYFYPDSYGYRPNKSALDAVGVTRQRCWKYDWCLEFDIKGLFDYAC